MANSHFFPTPSKKKFPFPPKSGRRARSHRLRNTETTGSRQREAPPILEPMSIEGAEPEYSNLCKRIFEFSDSWVALAGREEGNDEG